MSGPVRRARFGSTEAALLALFLLLDQGTKLGATAALTHRLDGRSALAALGRMYSPSEYRGPDGRTYVRNYGPKSERTWGRHLALRYSEDELEAPPSWTFLVNVWLLRGVWLVLLAAVVVLGRRWAAPRALHGPLLCLAGALLGTGLDLATHLFSVNFLELADVGGLTLRFNLCGLLFFGGLVGLAAGAWAERRARRAAPRTMT